MAYASRLTRLPILSQKILFPSVAIQSFQPVAAASTLKPNEDFWDKNKRLARPLSPHLRIYKPQLTSGMSITHRGTGVALGAGLYGFSLGMLMLPASYPHYICVLQSMHIEPLICLTKFGIAAMFFYHYCNGIRHLAWDFGYGYEIPDLYKSGFVVAASALILATLSVLV